MKGGRVDNILLDRHACRDIQKTHVLFLDVNECDFSPCDADGFCEDTEGSFMCACNNGYSGNGFSCQS